MKSKKAVFLIWTLVICMTMVGCSMGATKADRISSSYGGGYHTYESVDAADVFWGVFAVALTIGIVASMNDWNDGGDDFYEDYHK